jgi:peptide/nickel transport system substrate-binding protein
MTVRRPSVATNRSWNSLRQRTRSRGLSTASAVVLLAAVPVMATGCGDSASTAGGSSTGPKITKLRIALNNEASLDPARSNAARYFASLPFSLGYAPIFHQSPEGKVEPALATEWGYVNTGSSKNKVFEFTLRTGAKFSDGAPVNAAAVAKWLKYFVSSTGNFRNDFGAKPKFTAVGAQKVRIEMRTSNPSLPVLLSDQGDNSGFVASPNAVDNPKVLLSGTYGAGPYQLKAADAVRGDHYTYRPNPNYYDKAKVRFKEVYLKIIANPSSRLQAQQSGQYDVTLGDTTTQDAAKAAGLQVSSVPQGMIFLALDSKNEVGTTALRDVRVRQAINYAIDRKSIASGLFGKTGAPADNWVTADVDPAKGSVKYPYDPEKAKQLLAAAKLPKGTTLKALAPGYFGNFGTPLMNAVAQQLQAVGIKLDTQSMPNEAALGTAVFKYQFDVTSSTWSTYLAPNAPLNLYGTDPEVVRLYEQGAAAEDPTDAWSKMWRRYTSQAYSVPLVAFPAIYYASKGIGGVSLTTKHVAALPSEWYPTGR